MDEIKTKTAFEKAQHQRAEDLPSYSQDRWQERTAAGALAFIARGSGRVHDDLGNGLGVGEWRLWACMQAAGPQPEVLLGISFGWEDDIAKSADHESLGGIALDQAGCERLAEAAGHAAAVLRAGCWVPRVVPPGFRTLPTTRADGACARWEFGDGMVTASVDPDGDLIVYTDTWQVCLRGHDLARFLCKAGLESTDKLESTAHLEERDATGMDVIAINHDPEAIDLHRANHPRSQNVWHAPVDIHTSPDCKHYSKAAADTDTDMGAAGGTIMAWAEQMSAPQPAPRDSGGPAVWPFVIADMQARDASGQAKYGTPLQAHNGRDALVDAYQESLDLAVYLRQVIIERDSFGYDLVAHLRRQLTFIEGTFGPLGADGAQTVAGVLDHLIKEIKEARARPDDALEWADVILLSLSAALRAGHRPDAIARALSDKMSINEGRGWPDWRTQMPDRAIEHVAGSDERPPRVTAQAILDAGVNVFGLHLVLESLERAAFAAAGQPIEFEICHRGVAWAVSLTNHGPTSDGGNPDGR
jgi:hypothetical protein